MKKAVMILLVCVFAFSCTTALAEEQVRVIVNGVEVEFDQAPIIVDGRTLVPIRAVTEQIGAEVRWNGATQTVTVLYRDTGVALQIGNSYMTARNLDTGNERLVLLDVPPQLYSARTLLPIRAVMEEFGCKVDWDNASKTVIIATEDYASKTIVIGE
ncbi:MAG: copper amine oxidase N-terminal domain-containing protein [Oscillospiraceae bacterium]|nr:copper amine oxidase N-terminal domain-containing protein [Oscillospiraceae bacterium]